MAKERTKVNKKINGKVKRRIRKTVASLLLVSAIVVAAIPVPGTMAATMTDTITGSNGVTDNLADNTKQFPTITENDVIYCNEFANYQFCYKSFEGNNVAILIGVTYKNLPNDHLDLPDYLDAFVPYSRTYGSNKGNVAASMDGNFLYYKLVTEHVRTKEVTKNADGSETISYNMNSGEPFVAKQNQTFMTNGNDDELTYYTYQYSPCLDTDMDTWILSDGVTAVYTHYDTVNKQELPVDFSKTYCDDASLITKNATSQDYFKTEVTGTDNQFVTSQRLTDARVAYISSMHLEDDGYGDWIVEPFSEENGGGVLSRFKNIKSIFIPDTVLGIGNHAFYGCGSLEKVTFTSGIYVVGKSAFENCTQLHTVDIPVNVSIDLLPPDVFKGCSKLQNFTVGQNITKIGDSAFQGCGFVNLDFSSADALVKFGNNVFKDCRSLQTVTLPETDKFVNIGLGTFQNCQSLEEVYFPDLYDADIPLSIFSGCGGEQGGNLKHIQMPNNTSKACETASYSYETFMSEVHPEFYFEGYNRGALHQITKDEGFAFKYMDESFGFCFEKIVDGVTYWVNENNELIEVDFGTESTELNIPESIGPYAITSIGSDFAGNQKITSAIIPTTITQIADGAFAGCNKLTTVTFNEPNNIEYIGTDAFKTESEKLEFVGTIDAYNLPFQYAMDPDNNFNNANQTDRYISFTSGFPQYIKVHYNPDTGKTELFEVPIRNSADYKANVKNALKNAGMDDTDSGYASIMDDYDEGNWNSIPPNVFNVIDAAHNIVVPSGVQSIEKGLFSDAYLKDLLRKDNSGNTLSNSVTGDLIKEDAFQTTNVEANDVVETITLHDVEIIDDYAFYGCENLKDFVMYPSSGAINYATASSGERIGKYALAQCPNLRYVALPSTLGSMGVRPFAGDESLTQIYFTPDTSDTGPTNNIIGDNFSCESGIIYELDGGYRDKIVQCLETRGKTSGSGGSSIGSTLISASELAGITEIYKEAFMNCRGIGTVELDEASVKKIPAFCFANADGLVYVDLPVGCNTIDEYAFKDTAIKSISIPATVSVIDSQAFYDSEDVVIHDVEVITSEGSTAERLAEAYSKYYWSVSDTQLPQLYTVTFVDEDNKTVIDEQMVMQGEDAVDPREKEDIVMPEHEGKVFSKWLGDFTKVGRDIWVLAEYTEIPDQTWTVNFYDWDMTLIVSRTVPDGGAAEEPKTPSRTDYVFKGWSKPFDKVTADVVNEEGELDVMALYDYNTNGTNGGSNGSGGSTSGNNSNNNSNNNAKTYTVTVVNGSGSGSYVEGATVIVAAYAPNKGYQFHKWTSNDDDVDFASESVAATTFKMPDENVTVTANYITTSESGNTVTNNKNYGTVTSAPSSNKGSTSSKPSSKNDNDGSTSVDVNRPGIKNENLASATVNGSTDNFVVRVSETPEATAAVAQALKNEYGNLDNIRYFAMDINLYDETGKKKITDTEGLTVTITLPLPDELRQYAGNNKVGAVANNKLEKLAAKFTTVADVPCVTFTATHFSPYTIYVDTGNLTEGIADSTPTTGDGIHPKWFLVIGLGCISALLFMKRDKNLDLAVE